MFGLTPLEVRLASLEFRLTPLEVGFTSLECGHTPLEVRFTSLEFRLKPLEVRLTSLESGLTPLKVRLTPFEFRLGWGGGSNRWSVGASSSSSTPHTLTPLHDQNSNRKCTRCRKHRGQ